MDLSGHSVSNDKQEENIWMFVYTIVYLQGKMKVFLETHCFSDRIMERFQRWTD